MSTNDLDKKYSLGTRIIHWLTASSVLILFPLGKYMDGLNPVDKMDLVQFHAMLGDDGISSYIVQDLLFL